MCGTLCRSTQPDADWHTCCLNRKKEEKEKEDREEEKKKVQWISNGCALLFYKVFSGLAKFEV